MKNTALGVAVIGALLGTLASAADMPLKAPPAPTSPLWTGRGYRRQYRRQLRHDDTNRKLSSNRHSTDFTVWLYLFRSRRSDWRRPDRLQLAKWQLGARRRNRYSGHQRTSRDWLTASAPSPYRASGSSQIQAR